MDHVAEGFEALGAVILVVGVGTIRRAAASALERETQSQHDGTA
jgi:hypothetical protein